MNILNNIKKKITKLSYWIYHSLESIPMKEEKKEELYLFWNDFYSHLDNLNIRGKLSIGKSSQYNNKVFELLNKEKNNKELDLFNLQTEIENMTMQFDESSIFKSFPYILKKLVQRNSLSAKDYLRSKKQLCKDDVELLSEFVIYTIEAIIVHVLGIVFNPLDELGMIRVASLVEQLESGVRRQALLLKRWRCIKHSSDSTSKVLDEKIPELDSKISQNSKKYPFGTYLVEFMVERELIYYMNDIHVPQHVKKKNDSYYIPRNIYVCCNFDVSLLPIQLNLPMVYKPIDWQSACKPGHKPRYLSDLSGGYLSQPLGEMYNRYRLLSSGNSNHFYIELDDNYQNLCDVMNKLQSQPFQINSQYLQYLKDNELLLVKYGLLMPPFLASINFKDVEIILREFYMKNKLINNLCSYSELVIACYKNIQRACYERFIFNLASAYDGYEFYLPAFLDFRGRIYRSGILHFHERDLARSLIIFATNKSIRYEDDNNLITNFWYPTFHLHHSIYKYEEYQLSVKKTLEILNENSYDSMIFYARDAKHPFQYLRNIKAIFDREKSIIYRIPITQDASASAYQIMSFFLLDRSMATITNLIPSKEDKNIQDVYSSLLEELKDFMEVRLEKNLSSIIISNLNRKLVKSIFMPMIYGKSLMSTAGDIKDHLGHFITHKECFTVASVCFQFWRTQYSGMECLIRLIRNIGWVVSAGGRPVIYGIPYFTTVQDYMVMEPINIWIYNKINKKRRRVTLRVSSSKRDRRKTDISTFVNFIHQKDANIAMNVVNKLLNENAPIYTVHDNFISCYEYCHSLPQIYCNVFSEMGPPLLIINEFIKMNLFKPISNKYTLNEENEDNTRAVFSKKMLNHYLHKHVPKKLSKQQKEAWDARISGILTCYDNYTRIVCGDPSKGWLAHEDKWTTFKSWILRSEGEPNYSVHY